MPAIMVSAHRAVSKSSVRAPSSGLSQFLEQKLVRALELAGRGSADGLGSGGSVQARVDRLVGLAGEAREVGHEARAAVAQLLAHFAGRWGTGDGGWGLWGRGFVVEQREVIAMGCRAECLVHVGTRTQCLESRRLRPL